MDAKTRPVYMLYTRDKIQTQGHIQTKSEVVEKDIPCNGYQKKAGIAILISDKIDFKIKNVTDKQKLREFRPQKQLYNKC